MPGQTVASASLVPWFTAPRMVPKWMGAAIAVTVLLVAWTPAAWVALPLGFAWFFPNEYAIHRWVYHRTPADKQPSALAKSHIEHHLDPTFLGRIFNAPSFSVTIGLLYILVVWALTRSWGIAGGFATGAFAALLYYEYVHFTAHRPGVVPWMPWNRSLKRMHLWHHYKNETKWFGVTTRVFDRALGSDADPSTIERSATVRTLVPPERIAECRDGRHASGKQGLM